MRDARTATAYRHVFALLLFTVLAFIIYSDTFHAGWHLDDTPNILKNGRLHINDLCFDTLARTFFARAGTNRFFRPLPSLSFALNWYAGRDNPFGYHMVNTAIHAATAFLVYLVIFHLLQTPALKKRYGPEDAIAVALLGALLWEAHPIQTQAVVYIVQRMAQMAALFYAAGLLAYLKARMTRVTPARVFWGIMTALFFICSVMSKENAVVFPLTLLIVESVFFDGKLLSRRWLMVWACLAGVVAVCGVYLFAGGNLLFFLGGYAGRPFTLAQRLMTEPRIVMFYLSQILYPLPSRLSICHDVTLSTSLVHPWTTLASVIMIAALIWFAFRYKKRFPLLSFALLFYFINHIVESSIIGLELVFEHRNYLPTLFLFAPAAALACTGLTRYRESSRVVFRLLVVCIVTVVTGLGLFTYERNRAWEDELTLWHDALMKAPGSSRPAVNLAVALAWREGATRRDEEVAMALFAGAIGKQQARTRMDAEIYGNMAILYDRAGEYEKAVTFFGKALKIDPASLKTRHDMVKSLIRLGRWETALFQSGLLIEKAAGHVNADYYDTRGFILLHMGRFKEALACFQTALRLDPYKKPLIMAHTGYALSRTGAYARAEWFYKLAQSKKPLRIETFFLLIENSVRAGDKQAAARYARILLSRFDTFSIFKELKTAGGSYSSLPLSKAIIGPVIKEAFYGIGKEAEQMGVF